MATALISWSPEWLCKKCDHHVCRPHGEALRLFGGTQLSLAFELSPLNNRRQTFGWNCCELQPSPVTSWRPLSDLSKCHREPKIFPVKPCSGLWLYCFKSLYLREPGFAVINNWRRLCDSTFAVQYQAWAYMQKS